MDGPSKMLVTFTDVVKDAEDDQDTTEAKLNDFPEAATGDLFEWRTNEDILRWRRNVCCLMSSVTAAMSAMAVLVAGAPHVSRQPRG